MKLILLPLHKHRHNDMEVVIYTYRPEKAAKKTLKEVKGNEEK